MNRTHRSTMALIGVTFALGAALVLSACAAGGPAATQVESPTPSHSTETDPCPPLSQEEIMAGDQLTAEGAFVPWADYQQRFGVLVETVRSAYPEDYATAFVEANCARGTISFKGAVPAGLPSAVAPVEGVTYIADAGLSESEAQTLVVEAMTAAQHELGEMSMSSGYDWSARVVRIELSGAELEEPSAPQLAALEAAIATRLDLPEGVSVELEYSENVVIEY